MHNRALLRIFKHFQIDGRTAPATCAVLVAIGSLLLSNFHKNCFRGTRFLAQIESEISALLPISAETRTYLTKVKLN